METNIEKTRIEYSKDLNFFLENQICVACSNKGKHITIFSLIDGECFLKVDDNKEWSDEKIMEKCVSIHSFIEKNPDKYLLV
jgi:hypothetical protein